MDIIKDNEGLNAFSSIDIVSQCLVDTERTESFEKAIKRVVKEGHNVVDLGTGSGIMSLFAARAGAKKVTAIEFDPYIGKSALNVVKENKFDDVIEIRISDARNCYFPPGTNFDVVIAELVTTGLIDEHQVAAINNLHKQRVISGKTKFIPSKQKTFAILGYFEFETYGFSIPFIRHLWRFHRNDMRKFRSLSSEILLNEIDFKTEISEEFHFSKEAEVGRSGMVNSVLFSSVTELASGISVGDTDAMNGPVVIPISPIRVEANQKLNLTVNYLFGGGFENVKISVI